MRTILVGWAALFLGAVAHADTLLLRDGRALVGALREALQPR